MEDTSTQPKKIELNDGTYMPLLGLGTWKSEVALHNGFTNFRFNTQRLIYHNQDIEIYHFYNKKAYIPYIGEINVNIDIKVQLM